MNKKLLRKKKLNGRTTSFQERLQARRELLDGLKMEFAPDSRIEELSANGTSEKCLLCAEPIAEPDVRDKKFFAFNQNKSEAEYFVHKAHLEPDGKPQKTNAQKQSVLQKIFLKIAELELGDLF